MMLSVSKKLGHIDARSFFVFLPPINNTVVSFSFTKHVVNLVTGGSSVSNVVQFPLASSRTSTNPSWPPNSINLEPSSAAAPPEVELGIVENLGTHFFSLVS